MLIRKLISARRGVAALEFALIAPMIIVLMIGVFDIARAMIIRQQVYNAAHMIPISASSLAVQPDKSTSLTVSQVQQSLSAIFAALPWRRSGALSGPTSVIMSSVTFNQIDPGCIATASTPCGVTPNVAWSVAYVDPPGRVDNGNPFMVVTRACGVLLQTAPTPEAASYASELRSLPTTNVTDPDPILVVDVFYKFTPLFFDFITGPVDFWASGYWPVRSVDPNASPAAQYTKYDIADQNGGAGKCPGYD